MALLDVVDLRVSFLTDDGVVEAVQGLSFSVERGKTLGIVGESGSGKSVATQAMMGLIPGARTSGAAVFEGDDLLTMGEPGLQAVRGAKIAMIFQDPLTSMHPLFRVGAQIAEAVEAHENVGRDAAMRRAVEMLEKVGIPEPGRRARDYPHQFSGGMRQRAMIAMALALRPALIIADEPTTALDVTVQAQILDLLAKLQAELDTAVILITHDLGVVADNAQDVVIMYAGRAMEQADVVTAFTAAHHPYTQGLLRSIPVYTSRSGRLSPIKGSPPSSLRPAHECPFAPRCPYVEPACRMEPPPLKAVGADPRHLSACILPGDRAGSPMGAVAAAPGPSPVSPWEREGA